MGSDTTTNAFGPKASLYTEPYCQFNENQKENEYRKKKGGNAPQKVNASFKQQSK